MNAILPYTQAQANKLVSLLEQRGVNTDRFQVVLESGLISDIFEPNAALANRLAVRRALGLGALSSTPGSHIVDYDAALEQMIAVGNYDWTNDHITSKWFTIVGKGKVEFEDTIFHFDRDISSEDVVKEILAADIKNPWEPGKIENILAYGAKNPEEQRKFPIVGLGSVGEVGGSRDVPYLGRDDSGRRLGLDWWDGGWYARCRFLGVRKKVSQALAS